MLLVALLAISAPQDATLAKPEQAADGTQRWSVLVEPCARDTERMDEVLICGKSPAPRLPLPAERGPRDRPMPSNPNLDGMGALAAASSPCATESRGCTTGIDLFGAGTAAIRLLGKIVDPDSCCEEPGEATNMFKLVGDVGKSVGRSFRKKPDKSKRVPILFDDLPPERKDETEEAAPQG
jgi:hypothetical protein